MQYVLLGVTGGVDADFGDFGVGEEVDDCVFGFEAEMFACSFVNHNHARDFAIE